MTTDLLLDLFLALVEAFFCSYIIIGQSKELRLKRSLSYIMGTLVVFAGATAGLLLTDKGQRLPGCLISVLFLLVAVFVLNSDPILKKIRLIAVIVAAKAAMTALYHLYVYLFISHDLTEFFDDRVMLSYSRMFMTIVFMSFATALILIKSRKKGHNTIIPVILISLLPLTQLVYMTVIFRPDLSDNLNFAIAAGIVALALNTGIDFLFVGFIRRSNRLYEIEKENEMKESLQNMDRRFFEVASNELHHTEEIKEDIKKKLEKLKGLLEEEQNGSSSNNDAKEVIDSIGGSVRNIKNIRFCEEPTVNMILNLKSRRAEALGIEMDISAAVTEDTGIAELDISSVVSNLIDNAIRAASEYKDTKDKEVSSSGEKDRAYVKVGIGMVNGNLVVRTENPTVIKGEIDDVSALKTTKDNSDHTHGLGLKILQNIVKRYQGNLTVDIRNNLSVFVASMKCNAKEA